MIVQSYGVAEAVYPCKVYFGFIRTTKNAIIYASVDFTYKRMQTAMNALLDSIKDKNPEHSASEAIVLTDFDEVEYIVQSLINMSNADISFVLSSEAVATLHCVYLDEIAKASTGKVRAMHRNTMNAPICACCGRELIEVGDKMACLVCDIDG